MREKEGWLPPELATVPLLEGQADPACLGARRAPGDLPVQRLKAWLKEFPNVNFVSDSSSCAETALSDGGGDVAPTPPR